MQGAKDAKNFAVLFLLIVLLTLSVSYVGNSVLTKSIVLSNSGVILTNQPSNNVTALSGSAQDIQAAVNLVVAAGGGTVYVPEGNFSFAIDTNTGSYAYGVNVPGGVNIVGAGKDKTILHRITPDSAYPTKPTYMFYIHGENGMPIRISGIYFQGYVTSENYDTSAIDSYQHSIENFRIDNCRFEDFASKAIGLWGHGVIDHNDFDNPYKDRIGQGTWGYGVIVWGDSNTWEPIDNYLGKYETAPNVIYIEDNTFSRCRHSIAGNAGGFYVVRYNTFSNPRPTNFFMVDVHGVSGGGLELSGRGLEAYGNIFNGASGSVAFGIRGGGGVIYNNTINNSYAGIWLMDEKDYGQPYCLPNDIWVWGNTYNNVASQFQADPTIPGTNYHLTAKSGYTPYVYPHPLTLSTQP